MRNLKLIISTLLLVFTSITFGQNPGGVTGSRLWLRSDFGTGSTTDNSLVYSWSDQSGNGYNAWVSGTPVFKDNSTDNINFNPVHYLNGSSNFNVNDIGIRSPGATIYDYTIIAVGRREIAGGGMVFGDAQDNGNDNTLNFGYSADNRARITHKRNNLNLEVNNYDDDNGISPFILQGAYDQSSGRLISEFRDGNYSTNSNNKNKELGGYSGFRIGSSADNNYDYFTGQVAEVVVYRTLLSDLNKLQVYSYFGLKYGITLTDDLDDDGTSNELISGSVREGDYVASDGSTVMWDYAGQGSVYYNQVAGIGRDDGSDLDQKQAKSQDPLALITIGQTDILSTNSANTNSFSTDKSFLLWANDGGNNSFTTTGAPSGRSILSRKWRVQKTGTIGKVKLQVPANTSTLSEKLPAAGALDLYVDADGNFASGAVAYTMTLNGTNWEVDINFADGDYFTFAKGGAELSVSADGDEQGPVNAVLTINLPEVNTTGAPFTFDLIDNLTGSASSGSDYTAIPVGAKISIPNGSQAGTYTITIIDDAEAELLETIHFSITNPSGPEFFVSNGDDTVTIADNDVGPGGVSSQLIFWLKADAGTNTTTNAQAVTSWADQTTNANDVSSSGTNPLFVQPSSNYNPSISFDGTGGLVMSNSTDINAAIYSQKSYSIVFKTGSDINTRQLIYEEGGGTHGLNTYIENGLLYNNLWVSSADNAASVAIDPNTDYILTFIYDGNSGRWDGYLNGVLACNDLSVQASLPSHTGGIGIGEINGATQYDGNFDVGSGDGFTGHVMEMIYFTDKALSVSERSKIESYLAVKYGVSLQSDYVSTVGLDTIWNSTTNAGYSSGVFGIGAQSSTELEQKQSGSELSEQLLSISLGNLANDNQSNTSTFSADGSYLLVGNNGGNLLFGKTGAPAGSFVMNAKWKVAETGVIGNVKIVVPDETGSAAIAITEVDSLMLLVDADGDFSSGATVVPMVKVGTNWEGDVDFVDGQFFTFSTVGTVVAPKVQGDESGPVDIVFELSLPSPNTSGVDITYDIADAFTGSATSGIDYIAISPGAQFVVPNGDSTATLSVQVLDDSRVEGLETIEILISNPSNPAYPLGVDKVSANIEDNDSAGGSGVVSGAVFWFRADSGTSSSINGAGVNVWTDLTGNGNDGTATGSAPLFAAVAANFNPGIGFFSTSEGYLIADAPDINTSNSSAKVISMAFRTGSDVNTLQTLFEEGGSVNGVNIYIESGQLKVNWWENSNETFGVTSIEQDAVYVVSYHYNGYSSRWDLYLNGVLVDNASGVSAFLPGHSGDIGIGSIQNDTQFDGGRDVSSGTTFLGDIMEMFYYNEKVFSANERNQLDSYLSLKYGVSYADDYLSSDSTLIVWDASKNLSFGHRVAGISEDSPGQLLQKQSSSEVGNSILTIGLNNIEVDNTSNNAIFSTGLDYLIWGDNDGELKGVDIGEIPTQSGITDRLERLWKIAETGNVGSVKLAFVKDSIDGKFPYGSYGNIYLRIAENDSLDLNPVDIPLVSESVNGVPSYTAEYDFNDSTYFSIIQKDFIVWDGDEWRGGLSTLVHHGPSDDPLDATKPMYILMGDTAYISEAVIVDSTSIDSAAVVQMNPQSCLTLRSISNQGDLILRADSSGFAQYNGPAVEATFEQFIDDAGWHLIGSPFSDVTWGDLRFADTNTVLNHPLGSTSLDSCSYCNLWWYDGSTDNGSNIGFGSSDAFGTWRSSSNVGESFAPDRGWNLWLDEAHGFSSAPWTVYLSGTFNDGDFTQIVNENNAGWNLMANPYPSALDWDVVDNDLAAAGIAGGYHIWDHENTNYAVYGSGTGTLGLTQYIAPFQGFYVQTSTVGAQKSGDVYHDFELENDDRPDVCTGGLGNFYKSAGSQEIVLQTRHASSGKKDETVIVLSDFAYRNVSTQEDIRKLFTPYKDAPSLYSLAEGQNLAIASIPPPVVTDSVQIGSVCKDGSKVTIEAIKAPLGYTIYLEDIKTGQWHRIDQEAYTYQQDQSVRNRFWLHFGPGSFDARPWNASKPFSIFVRNDNLVIKTLKSVTSADWYLTGVSGQIVINGEIKEGQGFEHEAYIGHLAPGTYVFRMKTKEGYFAEKIVIL